MSFSVTCYVQNITTIVTSHFGYQEDCEIVKMQLMLLFKFCQSSRNYEIPVSWYKKQHNSSRRLALTLQPK